PTPPDVDEERAALHQPKARPIHEALGGRSVGNGQDHEVGVRKQPIEGIGTEEIDDAWWNVLATRIDADDAEAEGGRQSSCFGTDTAYPDNEGSGSWQVNNPGFEG